VNRVRKEKKMRNHLAIMLLASAVAACATPQVDQPSRGVVPVNQPVVTRNDYAVDLASPDGSLSPSERARLDSWFAGLGLGYGDLVYVDGAYAGEARTDVARVAGKYGLLLSPGAPVTAGPIQPGSVRVVVSRTRASMPGCPNWDRPASPDNENHQMSNFGCAMGTNMSAMIANPGDLVHGREGEPLVDGLTAEKAIQTYRSAKPTGAGGLPAVSTKGN
jgi:pilus assembly protein CpaD